MKLSTLNSELSTSLVSLSDGRPGLRTAMQIEIREPLPSPGEEGQGEGELPVLDFISSDATLDRYGEVISAIGWELESYQRNPVFQNAHQYGDIIFTLGRALITEVRSSPLSLSASGGPHSGNRSHELGHPDGGGLGKSLGRGEVAPFHSSLTPNSHLRTPFLFQRIQFATDVNPMAKIAYGLYRGKFLSAVSVGFIPVAWENGTKETPYRRKYLSQELLEVSAVAIPANPNALALGLKSGAVEKSDLRDLADLVRLALDRPGAAVETPSPGGEGQGEGELSIHPGRPALQRLAGGGGEGGPSGSDFRLVRLAKRLHSIIRS